MRENAKALENKMMKMQDIGIDLTVEILPHQQISDIDNGADNNVNNKYGQKITLLCSYLQVLNAARQTILLLVRPSE